MTSRPLHTLPGALVISLDFELRWGVRDHCPRGSGYERNLHGARGVVPALLDLFSEFNVAATWATVGLLFARSRDEAERFRPDRLPTYVDPVLSPYVEQLGTSEDDDPLHYAPSLVERILATPRQELATHTFAHYFCNEPGQTAEQFDADLAAAQAIAAAWDVRLRSIVFPRNQRNRAYDRVLLANGIDVVRGNPPGWMWRFADRAQSAGAAKRAARLFDAYVATGGSPAADWEELVEPGGIADIRATFPLRPFLPRLARLEPLRLHRVRSAVRDAARRQQVLHLWWHPHNFGAHTGECLAFLRAVLEEFAACGSQYGMRSVTMAEAADLARVSAS
jgi:peptidoglycan/xylan/chitin deacetylase (PgdA/CDA1 family)